MCAHTHTHTEASTVNCCDKQRLLSISSHLVLAGNIPLLSDILSSHPHLAAAEGVGETVVHEAVVKLDAAEDGAAAEVGAVWRL